MRRLCCQLVGRLLEVSRVKLRKIPPPAPLQLGAPPLHFPTREVLVSRVDRLELAAINRNTRCRQQTHLAAQFNKLHADLLDRSPIILAEIGNRLVIGNQPARQPHHFDIASSLSLQPPTSKPRTKDATENWIV